MGNYDLDTLVEKFCKLSPKLSEKFKVKLDEEVIKKDLGFADIMVMMLVSYKEPAPIMADLARELSISNSMMTHIIDKLEKKDLVQRVRDTSDRREIRVKITQEGMNLLNKIYQNEKKHFLGFLEKLEPRKREKFVEALSTLMDIVEGEEL
jgi:DNA-binding MarR family transcriptional regulator